MGFYHILFYFYIPNLISINIYSFYIVYCTAEKSRDYLLMFKNEQWNNLFSGSETHPLFYLDKI